MYFTASVTLLGLVIASNALILNIGDKDFRKIFMESTFYKNIMVNFSITALILGVCASVSLIGHMIGFASNHGIVCAIFGISTFFMIWSIMSVVMIISNTMRHLGDLLSC